MTENEFVEIRPKVVAYIKKSLKNKKFADVLEKALYEDTLERTSVNEIKMFKYKIFKHRYNYGLGYLVLNLSELEEKIEKKEISPNDVFKKDPIELFPDKWEESKMIRKIEDKFFSENQKKSNSNSVCHKCKEQNMYVFQKQTRSADEPETNFYECLSCGEIRRN